MDKSEVIATAKDTFYKKRSELERHIDDVQRSANQESKSSVGDKYETARAMAQNEVFMLQSQLAALRTELETFENTNFEKGGQLHINSGSLVETTMGWFLLSSGLGKIMVNGKPAMCISMNSPLGKTLTGKNSGESYSINGKEYQILNVW